MKLPPPPYEIPLDDECLILMGKIAVLWGQIDEGLNTMLRLVLKIPPNVFESLLGNQMIGSRVNHLRAGIVHTTDPRATKLLTDLVDKLNDVLPARNAAMHGCWGRYVEDPSFQKIRVGTYNHQKPTVRFYESHLPKLYSDMANIMAILAELQMLAFENEPGPPRFNQNKLYFAPQPPDENARGVWFERGDRVIRVESKSRGWRPQ